MITKDVTDKIMFPIPSYGIKMFYFGDHWKIGDKPLKSWKDIFRILMIKKSEKVEIDLCKYYYCSDESADIAHILIGTTNDIFSIKDTIDIDATNYKDIIRKKYNVNEISWQVNDGFLSYSVDYIWRRSK